MRYRVRYLGIVPQPSTAVQGGPCETCDLRTYDVRVRDFARETQLVFTPIVGGQPVGNNCNVMSVQNIANLRSTVMWYRSRGVQYDTESIAVLDRSCTAIPGPSTAERAVPVRYRPLVMSSILARISTVPAVANIADGPSVAHASAHNAWNFCGWRPLNNMAGSFRLDEVILFIGHDVG